MQVSYHQRSVFSQLCRAVLGCFSAAICYSASSSPAQAFSLTYRASIYDINFTDPTFSDAIADYNAVSYGTTIPGEEFSFEVEVKPYFQNYTFMLSDSLQLIGGESKINAAVYKVRSLGTEGGYSWSYETPVAASPAGFGESWIQRTADADGGWLLEFLGGGSTSEISNQTYYELIVTIPGAWSCGSAEAGIGQLDCISIAPDYTILENFVYDAATDQTRFYAIDETWDGQSPELRFSLHSPRAVEAVPEPTTLVGVLVTAGGWLVARRRLPAR